MCVQGSESHPSSTIHFRIEEEKGCAVLFDHGQVSIYPIGQQPLYSSSI